MGQHASTEKVCATPGSLVAEVQAGNVKKIHKILTKNPEEINLPHAGTTPLITAINEGQKEIVHLLLKHGADMTLSDSKGNTPVINACFVDALDIVHLLASKGVSLDTSNSNGHTSMHVAAWWNNSQLAAQLLELGADPHKKDDDGDTPAHLAVQKNHAEVLEVFLGYNVNIGMTNNEGMNPLHLASATGSTKCLSVLCEQAQLLESRTSNGLGALHLAVINNKDECVKTLLRVGCDVNTTTTAGDTPLHMALLNKVNEAVLEALLEAPNLDLTIENKRANATALELAAVTGFVGGLKAVLTTFPQSVNGSSGRPASPLHYAAAEGHMAAVRALLELSANPNHQDKDGDTPFHIALGKGQKEVAEVLANHAGFDDRRVNAAGFTALHCATIKDIPNLVKIVASRSPDIVDWQKKDGFTALHLAALNALFDCTKILVKAGANLEKVENDGKTALALLCENKSRELMTVEHMITGVEPGINETEAIRCLKLLLNAGANIDTQCKDGYTPLQSCICTQKMECTQLLLNRGASVNTVDSDGDTVLHEAIVVNGTEELQKILIHHPQVDPFHRNKSGYNALHNAVSVKKMETVSLLLDVYPDLVDSQIVSSGEEDGTTALHLAVQNDFDAMVVALADGKRADVNIARSDGVTPLMTAVEESKQKLVETLLSYGANVKITDKKGRNVLHISARIPNCQLLSRMMLEFGAKSIDCTDLQGNTPLHHSANGKSVQCTKFLLENGAALNVVNSDGDTALHVAVVSCADKVVTSLVEQPDCDFSITNKTGYNAAQEAVRHGNVFATELLFPKLKITDGLLHLAVSNNQVAVAELLLKLGLDPEARDANGQTPLLLSASEGFVRMMDLLVEKGANLRAIDFEGNNAAQLPLIKLRSGDIQDMKISNNAGLLKPVFMRLPSTVKDREEIPQGMLVSAWAFERGISITEQNSAGQTLLDFLADDKEAQEALQYFSREGKTQCVVCLSDPAEVLFQPCDHRVCCSDCSSKMRKCIKCKRTIFSKVHVDGRVETVHSNQPSSEDLAISDKQKEELHRFKEEMLCLICRDAKRAVAFNCGHTACADCAQNLKECHLCRNQIKLKITLAKDC